MQDQPSNPQCQRGQDRWFGNRCRIDSSSDGQRRVENAFISSGDGGVQVDPIWVREKVE